VDTTKSVFCARGLDVRFTGANRTAAILLCGSLAGISTSSSEGWRPTYQFTQLSPYLPVMARCGRDAAGSTKEAHAASDIRTTMRYGTSGEGDMRQAQEKIVRLALIPPN